VSLDYCADQYVLKLADREQILAISPDGDKEFSYMHEAAEDVPTVRPVAEDVLVLKPDLVVRAYGGGPNAEA
ncbi:MAG: ABC transporter substrate-binding protein, partial [Hyphomonas sp.]|nr:ABC transporter substrate-binding protein [Hyphomonas sp.]